jgi:hypothetical protein
MRMRHEPRLQFGAFRLGKSAPPGKFAQSGFNWVMVHKRPFI